MLLSYIAPRRKTIFTQEVQLVLTFFTITLVMLFSTYFFLLFKQYTFESEKKEIQSQQLSLEKSLQKMQDEISFIEIQQAQSESIFTKNSVLKESITNLFDLVPSRITLSKAELLKDGLILYGITPNRDVYNFMLQAPLRSIFHKTYSSFYPQENGWLRFVSTNYVDNGESLDE